MFRLILTLFLSCVCTIPVFAQQENGVNFLQKLNEAPALKNAQVSVYAKYIGGSKIIAKNEDILMVPASVLKLFTTASALKVLGEHKTFETKIYLDGEIKNSILYGDIYLRGAGDPSLGSKDFKNKQYYTELFSSWAKVLKRKGIKEIKGNIYADNSIFSGILLPWRTSYKNIGNYFAPKADALSIANNQYTLLFAPTKTGDTNIKPLSTEPQIKDILFKSEVSVDENRSREDVYATFEPLTNIVNLTGTLPLTKKKTKVYAALPNPAQFAAESFLEILQNSGIKIDGKASIKKGGNYNEKELLFTHSSPTLAELVKHINKFSDNLYAEVLLRDISAYTGGDGSAKDGLKKMKQALISLGLEDSGFDIYGGSGLDYTSNVSCRSTVTLLENILSEPYFESFKDSLVIAGNEREKSIFDKRVAKKDFAFKTYLKTGTLDKARNIAGYTEDKNGKQIIFCFFINNFKAKTNQVISLQDSFLEYLTNYQ